MAGFLLIGVVAGVVGGFAAGRQVGQADESDQVAVVANESSATTTTVLGGPPAVTALPPLAGDAPSVVVIGNSIAYLSELRLEERLSSDFALSIRSVPGMRITQSFPLINDYLAASDHYAVVIELGTNDVGGRSQLVVSDFAELSRMLDPVPCRVYVTVTTHTLDDELSALAAELNEWILDGELAGAWRVVDWDSITGDYQADGEPFGPLTTDLVHPTPLGQDLLAANIADEVRACS